MSNQFTCHHEFRIDTRRTKFEQKTDSILSACESFGQNTRILRRSTWKHRVLHGTSRQRGRNIKTRCIQSISNLIKGRDSSSIRRDRTPSSFTTHSQPIVSRKLWRWNLENSFTRRYMRHLDFFRRFPLKTIDEGIGFRSCWTW